MARDAPEALAALLALGAELARLLALGQRKKSWWLETPLLRAWVGDPPLPYKVDTSRPSLRTNWTRLVGTGGRHTALCGVAQR